MKSLFWLLFKVAIFFILFAFAIGNRDEVTLHFMLGHAATLPMIVVILGSFVLGVFFGILVMVLRYWQAQRGVKGQKTAVTTEEKEVASLQVPRSQEERSHNIADPTIPYEP